LYLVEWIRLHHKIMALPYTSLFRSASITSLSVASTSAWRLSDTSNSPVVRNGPSGSRTSCLCSSMPAAVTASAMSAVPTEPNSRSEEHTSELQSRENLVCRLLLEKK